MCLLSMEDFKNTIAGSERYGMCKIIFVLGKRLSEFSVDA